MKTSLFCNNCGKSGHLILECKMPITSIGIIVFRKNKGNIEYLMVCRKDSFGYSDFIKCKFPIIEDVYLLTLINEMTTHEKDKLKSVCKVVESDDFNINNVSGSLEKKIFYINNELSNNGYDVKLSQLIERSDTSWDEPEWGFPKGRRNNLEKDLDCAIREFEEETGYKRSNIKLIENIIPYEEIFVGSNYKNYKHKYYIAYMPEIDDTKKYQKSEISNMEWKTESSCLNSIREYNLEKISILKNINNVLNLYRIYD